MIQKICSILKYTFRSQGIHVKNETYKNKLNETHKNSSELDKNFNVFTNFNDKKEDNGLKFITDPNFTFIKDSDICKSNPLRNISEKSQKIKVLLRPRNVHRNHIVIKQSSRL